MLTCRRVLFCLLKVKNWLISVQNRSDGAFKDTKTREISQMAYSSTFFFMYDLLVVCLLGVVSSNEDGFLIGS